MTYGYETLLLLQYQIDLQFGLKSTPIDIADTTTITAPLNSFYYGIMADAASNAVIDSAKDLNGNVILEDFAILAGQRLDGAFTEIKLTSGRVYTQRAPLYNPLQPLL